MARYRFLAPHYISSTYYETNDTADLPADWKPTGEVEPLDAEATDAFYAMGPQPCGLIRSSWQHVPFPKTYWVRRKGEFVLVGLGEGRPTVVTGSIEFG
jgi:hypothetical protein